MMLTSTKFKEIKFYFYPVLNLIPFGVKGGCGEDNTRKVIMIIYKTRYFQIVTKIPFQITEDVTLPPAPKKIIFLNLAS